MVQPYTKMWRGYAGPGYWLEWKLLNGLTIHKDMERYGGPV